MKNLALWQGATSLEEDNLAMAPLSFSDDRGFPPLKNGSWVNGNCLTRVECIRVHEDGCSNNALEPGRGPLDHPKDRNVVYPPPQNRRRVSFDFRVGVKEIPSARQISDEERVDVWWTQNDYMLIRKMLRITMQMLDIGEKFDSDDEDFCSRGLGVRSRNRQRQKLRAKASVLNIQDFQRTEGFRDPEYIAEVYGECCRSSCEVACELAAVDAREVASMD